MTGYYMDHEGYQRWLKESKGAWYTGLGMLISGAEGSTGGEYTVAEWNELCRELKKVVR